VEELGGKSELSQSKFHWGTMEVIEPKRENEASETRSAVMMALGHGRLRSFYFVFIVSRFKADGTIRIPFFSSRGRYK
jgi:hypothetical protein